MTVVVDTPVLIDVLRGHRVATQVLAAQRRQEHVHGSEVVRLEVLAGVRPQEEDATRRLLRAVTWHPLDEAIVEEAGRLGRRWLPSHSDIDTADLVVAATATLLAASLLTVNVRHFPMFDGLAAPYEI